MIMKINFPILRQILFAAAPLVLLAGCSDKDDPAPIGVAGVEMSQPTLELALDGTERLTAAVTPDNAADKTLTWSSSDEAGCRRRLEKRQKALLPDRRKAVCRSLVGFRFRRRGLYGGRRGQRKR